MTDTHDPITIQECSQELQLLARRTGLLHYYFSKAIVDRLGFRGQVHSQEWSCTTLRA